MAEAILGVAAFGAFAVMGFLLPGWLLSRLLPTPGRPIAAFLGSAVILFYVVLGYQIAGIPVHIDTLRIGVVSICSVLWIVGAAQKTSFAPQAGNRLLAPQREDIVWLIPAFLGLAAIAALALLSPLSGPDNSFRWEFLARHVLANGDMSFYPPVSANDYHHYAWSDGIPPLASIQTMWTYVSAGRAVTSVSAAAVILQGLLIFYTVARLAQNFGGRGAGWPAAALLATSSLSLWCVSMGQETGLTTLSFAAMWFFLTHPRGRENSIVVWAAVAAATGGLSREYGLAWLAVGATFLLWQRAPARTVLLFVSVAACLVAPWYLRNYLRTGNPLFAQSLHGLFPVPPIHQELMDEFAQAYRNLSAAAGTFKPRLVYLAVVAGITLLGGVLGVVRLRGRAVPLVGAAAVVGLLWIWSIAQTAGGFSYSTRVLGPGLAVCAALGGTWLAGRSRFFLPLVVTVTASDAAVRSFYLPFSIAGISWTQPISQWFNASRFEPTNDEIQICRIAADAAKGSGIVIDQPGRLPLLLEAGGTPVPIQSPQCAALFDETITPDVTLLRLREADVRFLLLSTDSRTMNHFAQQHRFLGWLRQQSPVIRTQQLALFDLAKLHAH